ncbi:MAG: CBS domain-containing protein [Rubripirellula sp.]
MNQNTTKFVTSECPSGHRVRGDFGWLNRRVRCPHCHAEFVFKRPGSQAANVVAVQSAAESAAESDGAETDPKRSNRNGSPSKEATQLGDWESETGVMRILGDYVPPPPAESRRCGECGTTYPAGVTTCENCSCELLPAKSEAGSKSKRESTDENQTPIDFREVDKIAFDDVIVRRVIRPRREIAFLDINDPIDQMRKQVRESMHSRYPVCDHSLDKMLGVVHIKDILVAEGDSFDVRSILEKPDQIPDSTPVSKVLQHFQNEGVPMAFVLDEYENLIGIVTLKDVLSKLACLKPEA